MIPKLLYSIALVGSFLMLSGCGTPIKPSELRRPASVTCILVPETVSVSEPRGLANVMWHISFEHGAYIAEGESDEGTFYRAPPGGISTGIAHDGGLFVPRDAAATPRLYRYVSNSIPSKQAGAESCSEFFALRDPVTSQVSVVAAVTGGAVGGLAGRAIAGAINPRISISYGQAAVGGAIGMGIVAAIINAGVGKIEFLAPMNSVEFNDKLKKLAAGAVPIREDHSRP